MNITPTLKLVALYFGNPESGVTKKILYQVQALRSNDIDARLVLIGNAKKEDFNCDFIDVISAKGPPYKSIFDKMNGLRSLRKGYEKVLLEGDVNDVIFFRSYIPAGWFLKAIKKTKKTVILELLANNFKEAILRKSYLYYCGLHLYHKKILRNVDLIVSVTMEILEQHFNLKKYPVPYMVIGNGIQIDAVPLQTKNTIIGPREYHFTCIAQVATWHGIDRVLKGLHAYKGRDHINFHIVGDGDEVINLKTLVNQLNLNNVFFHGFLSGNKLDAIFEKTDLAISTLAIHRTKITHLSVLKSREYCARGVPFVYGGIDDDFPIEFPFALRMNLSEEPIDINEILSFLKRVQKISDYNVKMRNYAIKTLSWNVKMTKLANYLLPLKTSSFKEL